jgi:hypothetical protein
LTGSSSVGKIRYEPADTTHTLAAAETHHVSLLQNALTLWMQNCPLKFSLVYICSLSLHVVPVPVDRRESEKCDGLVAPIIQITKIQFLHNTFCKASNRHFGRIGANKNEQNQDAWLPEMFMIEIQQ